ncbi:MAG: lycopene cyclase family protein [Leeuwenhoekiella sp.]
MSKKHYDYIIIGSGLAGLMMAYRILNDSFFADKTVLILDKDEKLNNDRTWCFWDKNNPDWEPIISKKWSKIGFKGADFYAEISLNPYTYNKIEGLTFYNFCREKLNASAQFTFKTETFSHFEEQAKAVEVFTDRDVYTASKVLTSILPAERLKNQKHSQVLQQHFIGWVIKAKKPVFDPEMATFMDFSIPQKGNTRFMYVLPTSTTEALVEYTLFSEKLLADSDYENAIKDYLKNLGVAQYEITATEKGAIPMTAYPFELHNTNRIIHIGTAGGWTRASTGFTFKYTEKITRELTKFLKKDQDFRTFKTRDRFRWYDRLFLDVLYRRNDLGGEIFSIMFKKNKIENILRFLDGESTIPEELKIIWSLPKKQFMVALFKEGSKG